MYTWYDDTQLEGKGVMPSIHIPLSAENAMNGTDEALEWVLKNY